MPHRVVLSLVTMLALAACGERPASVTAPADDLSLSVSASVLNPSRLVALAAFVPGTVSSTGAVTKEPVVFVFNLGTRTPSQFFSTISGRTVKTAQNGQFYGPNANGKKVLTRAGQVTRNGGVGSIRVAYTPYNSWGMQASRGTNFSAVASQVATVGYRDATGRTYTMRLSLIPVKSTITASTSAPGDAEGIMVPWREWLLPTVAHAQVAAVEAVAASSTSFVTANGNTNGLGRRWFDTCRPHADYASGLYSDLREIPGRSPSRVGGAGFVALTTAFFDDDEGFCSL